MEYCCETPMNNRPGATVLSCYEATNAGSAGWKADKEETKSFVQLRDQLASL